MKEGRQGRRGRNELEECHRALLDDDDGFVFNFVDLRLAGSCSLEDFSASQKHGVILEKARLEQDEKRLTSAF